MPYAVVNGARLQHIQRTERVKAWLRAGVVVLTALQVGFSSLLGGPDPRLAGLVGAALLYAFVVAATEPYRRLSVVVWDVTSGMIDWALITLGILATGGVHSDLYVLYFLSVLSVAMRYGFREVVIAGCGTALTYGAALVATGAPWPEAASAVVARGGYLLLYAVGSGLLAREANRRFRARLAQEAQRLAAHEMTATVSHDLRNPLTAIMGLVEILLDATGSNLSFDQRALLHRVNANAQQMSNLVNNLLDAELIGCGRQPFRPAAVAINTVVQRTVEAQAHQAEVKQIGLVLDLGQRLPTAVLDAQLIERVVANLLSNAVKFTPEGGAIRVSTACRGRRIVIEVWDSGPAVPRALRDGVFDRFVRQPDSLGAGLGLYICKSIVDMHGGRIRIDEPDGGGVSFIVELPLASAMATAGRTAARAEAEQWTPRSAWAGAGGAS